MTMTVLNAIANGAPGSAIPVDANFDIIAAYVDAELINRDGTIAMTSDLTLAQAPTSDLHASTKKYVDDSVASSAPTASVTAYAGPTAPAGYLLCDGAAVSLTTYAALYAIIGVTYGNPGGGNFNLPNLKDRFVVGKGVTTPHDTLGETGGSAATTLVSHTHPVTGTVSGTTSLAHSHANGTVTGTTNITHGHTDTFAVGGDGAHTHGTGGREFVQVTGIGSFGWHTGAGGHQQGQFATDSATHTHTVTGAVTSLGTSNVALASGVATIPSQGATSTALSSGTLNSGSASASTTPAGGSATNTNLPPYLTLNYIIKT